MTPTSIASAERFAIRSTSHSSASWRIGLDPMNAYTSTGMPARCEISTIGVMSETTVRPAQATLIESLLSVISRHIRKQSSKARADEPGSPMSATWMPSRSMRWSSFSFASIVGSATEGFCNPSRSVSSKNVTFFGIKRPFRPTSFQS